MSTNEKDVGDDIKISVTIKRQDTLVAVDPSIVTLYVKSPDGILHTYVYNTDPGVIRVGTGVYYMYYRPTVGGMHYYEWVGSGNMGAVEGGSFKVKVSQTR
jgi:hypothetical protein